METSADRLMQAIEDQNKIDKLNRKQKNVLQIINKYPESANDEAMLLERYWIEIDGWDDTKSLYWNLQRVTRPETISRRRRELFNLGLINYSQKALDDRTEAFENERNAHSPHEQIEWFN